MSVWNRCLSHLSNELSREEMNTWVHCLQPQESAEGIMLLAPNQFVLDWVRSHYVTRIEEIACGLTEHENFNVALDIDSGGETSTSSPLASGFDEVGKRPAGKQDVAKVVPVEHFDTGLNASFCFETFVEGKSNQLGRAAAYQIANCPGTSYNPLFIYGGVGLGKTHLMQSVGNLMVKLGDKRKVRYLHSERYVREMIKSLQSGTINEFKRFYRSVDALLIDDIQFFEGKERSQEEFFHTFNSLFEEGQQIILTSDRYPKEINGVEERLRSRFGWGLTVAVEPPELETRVAILNNKAEQAGYGLPDDVSFFIAQRVMSNVRELEGALRRVIANSQFTGRPITIEFAKEALRDLLAVQAKLVTIENIQKTVCDYYKLPGSDMLSKKRNRAIARPRQVAMHLSKTLTTHSLPEIGSAFGGRDHTTVLHAHRKIIELERTDSRIAEDLRMLNRLLSR